MLSIDISRVGGEAVCNVRGSAVVCTVPRRTTSGNFSQMNHAISTDICIVLHGQ